MTRFIANYIFFNSREWRNHIVTITESGLFSDIKPLSNELANTRYVPNPICVTATPHETIRLFLNTHDRETFAQIWSKTPTHRHTSHLTVIELDFSSHIATILFQ